MNNDETTRKVTPVELEENFALRDEIKELRILIAAIVRGHGRRLYVFNRTIQSIGPRDTFTIKDDHINDRSMLSYQEN